MALMEARMAVRKHDSAITTFCHKHGWGPDRVPIIISYIAYITLYKSVGTESIDRCPPAGRSKGSPI